mgnify:CR=1 FL=1
MSCCSGAFLHHFNTKKVRLKLTSPNYSSRIPTINFNTKKVRLKPSMQSRTISAVQVNFNTKKVRLKRLFHCHNGEFDFGFQYQKGAIKTRGRPASWRPERTFQYQKGAIKTRARRRDYDNSSSTHFNTKKVRLKRDLSAQPDASD